MQTHRKTIINTILEADELLLLATEEKKELEENYKAMSNQMLLIELISTLKLANRQIRFLENRINQIMPVSNLTELKFEQK
jgi:hypothetical protein